MCSYQFIYSASHFKNDNVLIKKYKEGKFYYSSYIVNFVNCKE